jgi:hypothetical protein
MEADMFRGDRRARRRPTVPDVIPPPVPEPDPDAFTVAEFCKRHRISIQFYYLLRGQGLTPAEIRLGTRVIISKEAAARWRAEREAATRRAATTAPAGPSPQ